MKKFIPTLTLTALLGSFLHAEPDEPRKTAQRDAPRIERPDWDSIKKRIEGAVARGDLTRDQAKQKYAEIKKKMVIRRAGPHASHPGPKPGMKPGGPARRLPRKARPGLTDTAPDALGQVLGSLVQQGKLNRMEAGRIRRAAGATPPPHDLPRPAHHGGHAHDHDAPAPGHELERMRDEMHELLDGAKREFAQIREIRRNLEEARHHQEQEMAEEALMAERHELEEAREAFARERMEIAEHHANMEREIHAQREMLERQRRELRERAEMMRERQRDRGDREREGERAEHRERERDEVSEERRERDRERDEGEE